MGAINSCGRNYDRDIIIPLNKSISDNVLVLEHVWGRHKHRWHAHCRDKITLENTNATS